MKHLKLGMLLGALFCSLLKAEAQSLSPAKLSGIRGEVQRINAQIGKARRARANVTGQSAEGGTLTNFWRGNILLKSSAIDYGEMGQTSREIWYRGGAPFFVFEQTRFYDRTLSGHVIRREEKRFYLNQGHLLAWKFGSKWQNLSPATRLALEEKISSFKKDSKRAS